MIDMPPGKYFISHAYKDADVRDEMLKILPQHVVPYIFPPISVSPIEFVSNTLIGAILACDAVICLNSGFSRESFWVAFERDYALRASKPVYFYSPERNKNKQRSGSLGRFTFSSLNLRVFWSASLEDTDQVKYIEQFMRESRYFDTLLPHYELNRTTLSHSQISTDQLEERSNSWARPAVKEIMYRFLYDFYGNAIGYTLVFWSKNSLNSPFQQDDISIAIELHRSKLQTLETAIQQIQNAALREEYEVELNQNTDISRFPILFATLDETPIPYKDALAVQLYGDKERSQINRIDDLIVRLYWLIFRNQFPELVYE